MQLNMTSHMKDNGTDVLGKIISTAKYNERGKGTKITQNKWVGLCGDK